MTFRVAGRKEIVVWRTAEAPKMNRNASLRRVYNTTSCPQYARFFLLNLYLDPGVDQASLPPHQS
jgi:hypothetical protein